MACSDFVLPELCKPCLFLCWFNLRNLAYPTEPSHVRPRIEHHHLYQMKMMRVIVKRGLTMRR